MKKLLLSLMTILTLTVGVANAAGSITVTNHAALQVNIKIWPRDGGPTFVEKIYLGQSITFTPNEHANIAVHPYCFFAIYGDTHHEVKYDVDKNISVHGNCFGGVWYST